MIIACSVFAQIQQYNTGGLICMYKFSQNNKKNCMLSHELKQLQQQLLAIIHNEYIFLYRRETGSTIHKINKQYNFV